MTADELLEVEKMGITVESHGHSHIDFSRVSEEEATADLARSIDILQDILGRRPRYFAYPWGRNSERARELVAQAGFEAAWSIEQPGLGNHARERVWIRRFHGLRVFSLKTTGRWGAFRWSRTGRATASLVRPLFFRRPR